MSGFLVFFWKNMGGREREKKDQHINWHDYHDNNRSTYLLIYLYKH